LANEAHFGKRNWAKLDGIKKRSHLMKRQIAAFSLTLVGLVASLIGFGVAATLNLDKPSDLSAIGAESRHINWSSIHKGYVSQEAVYQTHNDVLKVWHTYAEQFGVEPTDGMGAEGRCVQLTTTDEKGVFRSEVMVRLCPITNGTQVFFNQVLYLR
jgi:hypothetical protein